jgi:hypothetical protein
VRVVGVSKLDGRVKRYRSGISQIVTFVTILLLALRPDSVEAQEYKWSSGVYSYFDNVEFGGSKLKAPQTMSGIQVIPQLRISWDTVNTIVLGANILKEFGTNGFIGEAWPVVYYNYCSGIWQFSMGSIPRNRTLDRYPRLFFQDSLEYYRPMMNGFAFSVGKDKNYLQFWLDWTGRQSESVREAFFAGMNGRGMIGRFYLQQFGYMYHFASKLNPVVEESLHDNILVLTSAGFDMSGLTLFSKLDGNIGWVLGAERSRADNTGWIMLHGILVELRAEYKRIGLFNSLYKGSGLYNYYSDHGNSLYWGDPSYRASFYDRADIYIKVLDTKRVNLDLTYSLHFLESNLFHEQMLKLKINFFN